MKPYTILPRNKNLHPFVNDIFLMESFDLNQQVDIPIYADGYPGIMYSETTQPILLSPAQKELSEFYLYGQTVEPIILSIRGPYKIIVFQLFPFAAKLLLDVNPKELKDDCYDLLNLEKPDTHETLAQLNQENNTLSQVHLINNFIQELIKISAKNPDYLIKLAINLIISSKGHISMKEVREQIYITERTFERRFSKEVGVNPKQFAKIVQFNFSMNQLSEDDYSSLTELSYDQGFSDQSHFIRTFKRFAGKTPKEFQKQLSGS